MAKNATLDGKKVSGAGFRGIHHGMAALKSGITRPVVIT